MYEFKLSDLGEGIHEGEILKWHVEPGDTIEEDEPLVDVETDKAALTIPSPCSGEIVSRTGSTGDTVLVGDVIAVIEDGTGVAQPAMNATVAEEARESSAAIPSPGANKSTHVSPSRVSSGPPASWGRVVAVPATRRLARELKVDIRLVPPTGPAGRVTHEDVQRFAEEGSLPATTAEAEPAEGHEQLAEAALASTAADAIPFLDIEPLPDFEQWGPVVKEPLRSIRRKVARKMVTSMVLVPHVAHMDDADVTLLEEFRRQERERRGGSLGGG